MTIVKKQEIYDGCGGFQEIEWPAGLPHMGVREAGRWLQQADKRLRQEALPARRQRLLEQIRWVQNWIREQKTEAIKWYRGRIQHAHPDKGGDAETFKELERNLQALRALKPKIDPWPTSKLGLQAGPGHPWLG